MKFNGSFPHWRKSLILYIRHSFMLCFLQGKDAGTCCRCVGKTSISRQEFGISPEPKTGRLCVCRWLNSWQSSWKHWSFNPEGRRGCFPVRLIRESIWLSLEKYGIESKNAPDFWIWECMIYVGLSPVTNVWTVKIYRLYRKLWTITLAATQVYARVDMSAVSCALQKTVNLFEQIASQKEAF